MDKKTVFDDLEKMMFAFGDDTNVKTATRDILEEMLIDFVDKIINKSMKRSHCRGMYNKIIKDDILYLIRKNQKYLYRISYIIQKKSEVSKLLKETKEDV